VLLNRLAVLIANLSIEREKRAIKSLLEESSASTPQFFLILATDSIYLTQREYDISFFFTSKFQRVSSSQMSMALITSVNILGVAITTYGYPHKLHSHRLLKLEKPKK
jgi:CHASE1-domain containing sensor protein